MEILRHAHSGLRWFVLIAIIIAIVNALGKSGGTKPFTDKDRKAALFALIFTHVQFVIGLILYFISPKVVFSGEAMKSDVLRFFLVEHIVLMLIAVILITVGYSRSKKAVTDRSRFRWILIPYLIALILILAGIPWPFQDYGTSWF